MFDSQITMKYSLIGVLQSLFIVLLCDAGEIFWCRFTENGKQAYGFHCNVTAAELHQHPQQQESNQTSCIQFVWMQPNLTYATQMKFHKCDFDFIVQQCKSVQTLNTIDISYSDYKRLNFTHWPLDNLKKVNASHNRLQEIPTKLFAGMPTISEIDLSFNNLWRIDANAFENASQLIRIDLSNNNLKTLEPLQNNRKLQIIHATQNPILSFDCNEFAKMDTVSVFISWQQVEKLNFTCKKSTTQFRVIMNGTHELAVLYRSTTTQASNSEIHCTAGNMTNIDSCTVVGRNRFKNITQLLQCFGAKVKRLMLTGNSLGQSATAAAHTFERFTELEWLNLKDTALIEFDFRALKSGPHLMRLDLSQNNLTELKSAALLAGFNVLREFKVSGNRIQNLAEVISNLKGSIEWLDLTGNFVGQVSESTFQRLEHLTTLKLSNTSLMLSGNRNPFQTVKGLNIFDISENDLSTLDFSLLASTLGQLRRFYAANCQLTNATDVIQYLSGQQLLELDLSGNYFSGHETFTGDAFGRLTKLQNLHLNDANLRAFNFDWLKNNRELRSLKLSNNQLHSIHMSVLVTNLKRLELDGNDLIDLNDMKRSMVPQLQYLAISKNQFACENLIRFQQSFDVVKFIGDPLQQQKHGRNCCLDLNVSPTMGGRRKYVVIIFIVVAIMSLAMIVFAFTCFLYYYRKPKLTQKEKMLKKIRKTMRDSKYFAPTFQIPDDANDQYDMDEHHGVNDDIYDTISLGKHDYDHLRFATDPIPFDDDIDENYQRIGLINEHIPSRNVTSRL